jgi:Ca2+-binding EF-hand superfamily protein
MIDKAFLKFDKDGSGRIDVYDLKSTFNYQAHPKVQTREMNEEQVFIEFLQNFSDWKKDGTIPRDEWNDYYSAVSASVDNDDHFV